MKSRTVTPHVTIISVRKYPHFDNACAEAYREALIFFGIDEDGYSNKIKYERSTDSVHVKFISVEISAGYAHYECVYNFETWIERVVE